MASCWRSTRFSATRLARGRSAASNAPTMARRIASMPARFAPAAAPCHRRIAPADAVCWAPPLALYLKMDPSASQGPYSRGCKVHAVSTIMRSAFGILIVSAAQCKPDVATSSANVPHFIIAESSAPPPGALHTRRLRFANARRRANAHHRARSGAIVYDGAGRRSRNPAISDQVDGRPDERPSYRPRGRNLRYICAVDRLRSKHVNTHPSLATRASFIRGSLGDGLGERSAVGFGHTHISRTRQRRHLWNHHVSQNFR